MSARFASSVRRFRSTSAEKRLRMKSSVRDRTEAVVPSYVGNGVGPSSRRYDSVTVLSGILFGFLSERFGKRSSVFLTIPNLNEDPYSPALSPGIRERL